MDFKHSRRILAVGAPDSGALEVIRNLTGDAPQPHGNGSTAGLTHEWNVESKYYKAKVPIWIDEVPDPEAWKSEFLKPEAKEVVEAVGAWLHCFRMPKTSEERTQAEETMKAIFEVSEEHMGYSADSLMLAVALPNAGSSTQAGVAHEEWEDVCLQYGFEFIDSSAHGRNEFGEKVGFERVKEALEANEWADNGAMSDEELDLDELALGAEDEESGFDRDEAEMTAEIFGMKAALAGDDLEPHAEDFISPSQQKDQVDDLDRMMGKLLAVKESSTGLPEAQRRRMAAQAVSELMKENNL